MEYRGIGEPRYRRSACKTIETHARAFLPLNISAVGSVIDIGFERNYVLVLIALKVSPFLSIRGHVFYAFVIHWAVHRTFNGDLFNNNLCSLLIGPLSYLCD